MALTVVKYRKMPNGEKVEVPTNLSKSRIQPSLLHQYAASANQKPVIISPPINSSSERTLSQQKFAPAQCPQRSLLLSTASKKQVHFGSRKDAKTSTTLLMVSTASPSTSISRNIDKNSLRKINSNTNCSKAITSLTSLRNLPNSYNTGFVINKIPAVIKPIMKRLADENEDREFPTPFSKPKLMTQSVDADRKRTQFSVTNSPLEQVGKRPYGRINQEIFLPSNITIKPALNHLNSIIAPSKVALNTTMEGHGVQLMGAQLGGQSIGQEVTMDVAGGATEAQMSQNDSAAQQLTQSNILTTAGRFVDTQDSSPRILQPTLILQPPVAKRPTIFIKRDAPKRTIRAITLELIEKNPSVHLGVRENYLPLLKNTICSVTGIPLVEMYLTIKKLKLNEDFALLAEYFEMSEPQVQNIFVHNLVKLARFMKYLISWPKNQSHYERHRNLPFAYRRGLNTVQNMVECVETDMRTPLHIDCSNFKFIFSINTNNIITYISEAYIGHYDDLVIFNESNFKSLIPSYLTLVASPGSSVRRYQMASQSKEEILNNIEGNQQESQEQTESNNEKMYEKSVQSMNNNEITNCNEGNNTSDGKEHYSSDGRMEVAVNNSTENKKNTSHSMLKGTQTTAESLAKIGVSETSDNEGGGNIVVVQEQGEMSAEIPEHEGMVICEDQQDDAGKLIVIQDAGTDGISLSKYVSTRIAGELITQNDLSVVNDKLVSKRIQNFTVPTVELQEPICRQQVRHVVACFRDFKVLQRQAITDPILYQYLNEILIVIAGLINLQR